VSNLADTVLKLLPALLGIAFGIALRWHGVADQRDADFMFRMIVNIFLPALAFTALSRVEIDRGLVIFPLAAVGTMSVGYLVGRFVGAKGPFTRTEAAVVICCCMPVNTGFMLPFVQGLYGADGVARIAAFDAVNTTLTFTWTAYVAARANPRHAGGTLMLKRFATSPPLYAIAAGLCVSAFDLPVPPAIGEPIAAIGALTGILMAIGVGIRFEPPGRGLGKAALVLSGRLVSAVVVAVALVLVFGLTGADRTVLLLLAVAPTPFIITAFATMENLDVRLAVNTLSLSMILSLPLALAVIFATV
jgi:malate permease and related proteins